MRTRKICIAFLTLCFVFVFVAGVFKNVDSIGENDSYTRAYETYSRNRIIGLDSIGHTNLTITIAHNMSTTKSWVLAIDRNDYLYIPFVTLCRVKSVTTDPAIGEYFTGRISIKVTLIYTISGNDYEIVDYVST